MNARQEIDEAELLKRIDAALELLQQVSPIDSSEIKHNYKPRALLCVSILAALLSASGIFLYLMLNSRNPKYQVDVWKSEIDRLDNQISGVKRTRDNLYSDNFGNYESNDNCMRWTNETNPSQKYYVRDYYPRWYTCISVSKFPCNSTWHPLAYCRDIISQLIALRDLLPQLRNAKDDLTARVSGNGEIIYDVPLTATFIVSAILFVAALIYLPISYRLSLRDDEFLMRHQNDLRMQLSAADYHFISSLAAELGVSSQITRVDSMQLELQEKKEMFKLFNQSNPDQSGTNIVLEQSDDLSQSSDTEEDGYEMKPLL